MEGGDGLSVAAHALGVGATLVTSNVDHISRVPGLRVEDWRQQLRVVPGAPGRR